MTDAPKITEYALPGVLAEIARITTVEIAVAVARAFGGQRLSLPRREPKPSHKLWRAVGGQAARLICRKLGGEKIEIPAARTYLRWYDARKLRAQGKSIPAVARALEISLRQTKSLLRGFEPELAPVSEAPAEEIRARRGHHCDPRQAHLPGI